MEDSINKERVEEGAECRNKLKSLYNAAFSLHTEIRSESKMTFKYKIDRFRTKH